MTAMCGVKLIDRENIKELMDMLGLKETVNGLARANGVRWYAHVLRRDEDDILQKALKFKVNGGQRKRKCSKVIWEIGEEGDEKSWVEERRGYRSSSMEERSESGCCGRGTSGHPCQRGKTGFKLDR